MNPITPREAKEAIVTDIPDEVISAFNSCIASNLDRNESKFTQKKVIEVILENFAKSGKDMIREVLFANHWLDVEGFYRKVGWKVYYDKPAYDENYEPTFTFTINE